MAGRAGVKKGERVSTALRRRLIETLYRGGVRPALMLEAVRRECGDGVSVEQIRNDIVAIRKEWARELSEMKVGDYGPDYVERSWSLYRKAQDAGDFAVAYRILKDIAGLMGVQFVGEVLTVREVRDLRGDELEAEVARLNGMLTAARRAGKRGK